MKIMKKNNLLTIILLVFCVKVQAQKLLSNTKVKANQITYKVVGLPKLESETIEFNTVYNNNNQYCGKTPKLKLDNGDLIGKIVKNTILNAFNEAFSKARLKELVQERVLDITLYLSPTGKVMEVSFLLQKNSSLSALELENLENALKKNVYYNLDANLVKNGDFFVVSMWVRYQNILDGFEP